MSRLVSSTRARVLTAAVSSAAVALLGLGAVPSAMAAPPSQISGTVTNAGGAGIKGITVTAYDAASGAFGAEATTKADGSYTLKKLDAADYTVEFMDNSDTPLYATEYYDDQTAFADADPVTVGASQSVAGIDAVLARFGTISGTVTDEQGDPIGGIFIDVLTITDDGPPFDSPGGTVTASNGTYRFPFVPPGDSYAVYFDDLDATYVNEYYDDHLSIFESDLVSVTAGGTTGGIDAELATAGSLSGTVTDENGDGLGDIGIDLGHLVDGEWWSYGEEYGFHTAPDGTYDLGGLPPGTWRVGFVDQSRDHLSEWYDDVTDFEDATELTVTAGQETTGIDAELAKAAHVTGTVTDEQGHPLEGIFVALRALEDDHWSYFGDAETAADGTYSMDGLRPGTNYRVSFESQGDWAPEYWDDSPTIDDATAVTLTNGQTLSAVDAELAPAAHITGTVTDPAGQPYDFLAVTAWRWTGTTWEDFGLTFTDTFDDDPANDAAYDMAGLIPGTYRLEFDAADLFETPDASGLTFVAHEFWDDQPSLDLAQDVVVTTAGQVVNGKDAVLERGQYPDAVENLTPPSIAGTPAVGSTLTATPGTWNLTGTTYHYQWLAGTAPVGVDAPTYTPTATDVGKAMSVVVTGAVAGIGSATAKSAATAPVAAPVVVTPPPPAAAKKVLPVKRPAIKGTLEAGTKARVTAGRWTPADVQLSYRWYVGGKLVPKAHGAKLLLKEKWVGKRLRAKVVARADGYEKAVLLTRRSAPITS
jgi:5-hydroxyisourate hydrolase-like protein (transthyretin family)